MLAQSRFPGRWEAAFVFDASLAKKAQRKPLQECAL